MKKIIFSIFGVVAFTAMVAFNMNVSLNSSNLEMDITIANVEALAQGEGICSDCSACTGTIYACESQASQVMNDFMRNCGPGSSVSFVWYPC